MSPPNLRLVTVPLYISATIYFLIGLLFFALLFIPGGAVDMIFLTIMLVGGFGCFGIGLFLLWVIDGLHKGKKLAWIAGLVICAIYIPSPFLPIGVITLVGLLKDEVKEWFIKNT